jgi:hypothetical protein
MESYMKKTAPYTPEQNSLSELQNQTLVERLRTMLFEVHLRKGFWAEALLTATYLSNRSPVLCLKDITPHEAWTGAKPSVSSYCPFGCPAYPHVSKQQHTKLDFKAHKGVMIGYVPGTKAYRLWDPKKRCMFTSRDAIFDKCINPPGLDTTNPDLSDFMQESKRTPDREGHLQ